MESRRKKWEAKTDITPDLLRLREKKKWQIALRRYVIERNPSAYYAPYFGLDIQNLRDWLEIQFSGEMNWENFGQKWQFDHILPVACFDFTRENELRMCWNFINIGVRRYSQADNREFNVEMIGAKSYFENLYQATSYLPCLHLIEKIRTLESSGTAHNEEKCAFLLKHKPYLDLIENYSSFEFGLLNNGRDPESIKKEMSIFKKREN